MPDKYLSPTPGGTWFISRRAGDRTVYLHQDRQLFEASDAEAVLGALGIPLTRENLDIYFPVRGGYGRCPTLDLMELCNELDPTNPLRRKTSSEVGV